MSVSHLASSQWRVSGWSGGRGRRVASPVTPGSSRGRGAAVRRRMAGLSARVFTRRAGSAPTRPAAVRSEAPSLVREAGICASHCFHVRVGHLVCLGTLFRSPSTHWLCHLFQVEVTGAAGTTGVSAAKRVTPAGSAASGCVRAWTYRDTPAKAPGRRSAPATRRSVPVSDCDLFLYFRDTSVCPHRVCTVAVKKTERGSHSFGLRPVLITSLLFSIVFILLISLALFQFLSPGSSSSTSPPKEAVRFNKRAF